MNFIMTYLNDYYMYKQSQSLDHFFWRLKQFPFPAIMLLLQLKMHVQIHLAVSKYTTYYTSHCKFFQHSLLYFVLHIFVTRESPMFLESLIFSTLITFFFLFFFFVTLALKGLVLKNKHSSWTMIAWHTKEYNIIVQPL